MRKTLTIAILLLSLQSYSQVDKIIDDRVQTGIKKFIEVVGFDTIRLKSVSGSATLDTLTAGINQCSIYELTISGAKVSGTRVVAVTNTAGVMTLRFVDILPWSGTGKLNTVVTNNKVIVSVSGTTANYIYKREKKTE